MLNRIIILSPIVTEKSLNDAANSEYTFLVDLNADKKEIKNAVENEFKVHVTSVKTIIKKGKVKRVGKRRTTITPPSKKKALIKLMPNEKIDIFETGEKK